jgi:hypothetical protein
LSVSTSFNQNSACYAENVCAISSTEFAVPNFTLPEFAPPLLINDDSAQKFIFEKYLKDILDPSPEFAVIEAPFAMHNSFHNIIDQKATLFAMMYSLGMYSLRTLTLSNNNLEFYFPFQGNPSHHGGKQTMDTLYDYLTTNPVNFTYRMPPDGHCMSRALFNVPHHFSVDGRGIYTRPNYNNLLPDEALLLFPRHVVYNMATKLGLGGGYLSDPSVIPKLRDSVDAAEWMARKEREILWPLLADHYLNISESHGADKSTGPELKIADASSTHILFVHRVHISQSREMLNWDEFRDTLSSALSSRGYSFQFVNPIDMTAEEQVLVSSRATLYVSVHGANLANMVWMNPRSTTLEISSEYMKMLFFEKVAADYNTFYMRYVSSFDAGPDAGLLLYLIVRF